MTTNNMRLTALLRHIPQDVPVLLFNLTDKDSSKCLYPDAPTARYDLEIEGGEGSVIYWGYKPFMRGYVIVWVPML